MIGTNWFDLACGGRGLIFVVVSAVAGIAGCGGGGGGGESSPPPGASKVFLADSGNSVVASTANDNPSPGSFVLERTISGPAVSSIMPDLAYDSGNDRLYIVNNSSITVVNSASTANGSPAPSRTITSGSFVSTLQSVALDTVRNALYVADNFNVLVFDNVSTANGMTAPSRTLSVSRPAGSATGPDIIFLDTTRDILYLKGHVGGAGGINQVILVVDNASGKNGAITANREITFATASILGIAGDGDAGNRLFVADLNSSTVMVFDNASSTSGAAAPARTINMPTFTQKIKLAPAGNRLYGISSNARGVFIVNNASAANGAAPVTLATSPSAGALTAIAVAP
jgi:hypothetical protein